MKDIIRIYGAESGPVVDSNLIVEQVLLKVHDVRIKANLHFSTTVKYALHNLENFRPDIRTAIEIQVFNIWRNTYETIDPDLSGIEPGIPEPKEDTTVEETVQETDAAEMPETEAAFVEPTGSVQVPESFEQEPEAESFREGERQTAEKMPEGLIQEPARIGEGGGALTRRGRDWFDLLLDCSASMMNFFMRIISRK